MVNRLSSLMLHIQPLETLQFFEADQLVELVARAYFDGLHGEVFALVNGLHRLQVNACLLQRDILGTGRGAGDEQLVAHIEPTLTSAASTRNSATPMLEK